MRAFFESLSEKDRRRYAAVEAEKLGHGGIEYLASILGCDGKTIRRGREDIEQLPFDSVAGRIRRRKEPSGSSNQSNHEHQSSDQ